MKRKERPQQVACYRVRDNTGELGLEEKRGSEDRLPDLLAAMAI